MAATTPSNSYNQRKEGSILRIYHIAEPHPLLTEMLKPEFEEIESEETASTEIREGRPEPQKREAHEKPLAEIPLEPTPKAAETPTASPAPTPVQQKPAPPTAPPAAPSIGGKRKAAPPVQHAPPEDKTPRERIEQVKEMVVEALRDTIRSPDTSKFLLNVYREALTAVMEQFEENIIEKIEKRIETKLTEASKNTITEVRNLEKHVEDAAKRMDEIQSTLTSLHKQTGQILQGLDQLRSVYEEYERRLTTLRSIGSLYHRTLVNAVANARANVQECISAIAEKGRKPSEGISEAARVLERLEEVLRSAGPDLSTDYNKVIQSLEIIQDKKLAHSINIAIQDLYEASNVRDRAISARCSKAYLSITAIKMLLMSIANALTAVQSSGHVRA